MRALRRFATALLATASVATLSCGPVKAATDKGLSVEVSRDSVEGAPGETVDFDVFVKNGASETADVRLTALGSWIDIDSESRIRVPAGESSRIHLHLSCGEAPMVRHSWLLVETPGQQGWVVPVRIECQGAEDVDPDPDLLFWEPPLLEDATLLRIPRRPSSSSIRLEDDRDYLILFPDGPVTEGMGIIGGRNVVVLGGEIAIPHQDEPTVSSRRALIVRENVGTLHIEGMHLGGEDISEGIQISSPRAIVQLENLSIVGIHARDQVDFTDNHPDVVQSYGNARELRIDRMTASSDYQGLFLSASGAHGPVTVRRTNIKGDPTARYLFWVRPHSGSGDVVLDDVWLEIPDERQGGISKSVWPDVGADRSQRPTVERGDDGVRRVTWPDTMRPRILGEIKEGTPPDGDFVPPGVAGVGYESPGYVLR